MKPGNDFKTCFLFFALALLLVLVISCNPAKIVSRQAAQYEDLINNYIVNHPPRVDTNTVYIPGKIDSFYLQLPAPNLASIAAIKDSIRLAIENQFEGVASGCSNEINQAFDAGYITARNEFKKQKIAIHKPGTIQTTIYPTDLINRLKKQNDIQAGELKACQDKKNYLWFFIGSLVINAFLITLLFKLKK